MLRHPAWLGRIRSSKWLPTRVLLKAAPLSLLAQHVQSAAGWALAPGRPQRQRFRCSYAPGACDTRSRSAQHVRMPPLKCAQAVWPAIQRQRLPAATDCAAAAGTFRRGLCMHACLPLHCMSSCCPAGQAVHLWVGKTDLKLDTLGSLRGCGPTPALTHAGSPTPCRTPPHHSHLVGLTCLRTRVKSALSLQGRERMLPPQPSQTLQVGAQGQQRPVFGGGDRAPSMELLSQLKETGWPPPVRSSWLLKAASRGRRVAVSRPPATRQQIGCSIAAYAG